MTGKIFKKPRSIQGCQSAADNGHESRAIMYILTARKQNTLYVKLIADYVSGILARAQFRNFLTSHFPLVTPWSGRLPKQLRFAQLTLKFPNSYEIL
jgi:hypothetical protein